MKPQDVAFLAVVVALCIIRKKTLFVWTGLGFLAAAIPLFSLWVFFTAQRLTWYAAAMFLAAAVTSEMELLKRKGGV